MFEKSIIGTVVNSTDGFAGVVIDLRDHYRVAMVLGADVYGGEPYRIECREFRPEEIASDADRRPE